MPLPNKASHSLKFTKDRDQIALDYAHESLETLHARIVDQMNLGYTNYTFSCMRQFDVLTIVIEKLKLLGYDLIYFDSPGVPVALLSEKTQWTKIDWSNPKA